MRRSYEELKFLFDTLQESYSLQGDDIEEFAFMFLMHLKVTAFLSKNMYPFNKFGVPEVVYDGYKDIFYDGYRPEEDLEYIVESKITSGCLAEHVLTYYIHSPHWKVAMRNLYVDTGDKFVCGKDTYSLYVGEEFIRHHFGDFFDEEVYEDDNKLKEVTGYYEVGEDFTDDLCVIRSDLYPYVSSFKKAAGTKYGEKICYLEKAFKVIKTWLNGIPSEIITSQYGYLMCGDDSNEGYGVTLGCLKHERAVLVAGELIEEIMFSLDDEYHLLPEEIKRKEEERWKSWKML